MKQERGGNSMDHKQHVNVRKRAEIRDDLDHREGEEQDTKGDDVTHNKKETKREHLKKKDKSR